MVDQNPDLDPNDYLPSNTTFRNRVAREALGTAHTSLMSDQQTDLETLYDERFVHVFNIAKRIADIASDTAELPDEFQALFYEECVYRAILSIRGHEASKARRPHIDRAWDETIGSYSKSAFATASIASNTTLDMIDRYVTSISLRLPDRVLIPPEEIDLTTIAIFREIWNMRAWNFRSRHSTFQLETDGTITGNLTNNFTLDAAPGRQFVYRDSPSQTMRWVSNEELVQLRAQHWDKGTGAQKTGRPAYFRLQDDGSAKSIIMVPTPDQQYVVFGYALVETPTIESDARNSTTSFDLLPKDFHSALWDKVAGQCLFKHDRKVGRQLLDRASSVLDALGSEFDDAGYPAVNITPVDVYNDLSMFTSGGGPVLGSVE